jgi:hypothetical protein
MAAKKKAAKTKSVQPRTAAKRELVAPRGDKRYVRRDERGRIKESDDVGCSLAADRLQYSKIVVKPGQGDKGDRKRS